MNLLPDYILWKPTLTLCLICLCLFGCSTVPPTHYQVASEQGANGYSHIQLSENQYRVLFKGNKNTDKDAAKDFALLHAAELTTAQGYDWFTKQVKENVLSSLLITMGKGEPKTPLTVFDAEQLAENLRQAN